MNFPKGKPSRTITNAFFISVVAQALCENSVPYPSSNIHSKLFAFAGFLFTTLSRIDDIVAH